MSTFSQWNGPDQGGGLEIRMQRELAAIREQVNRLENRVGDKLDAIVTNNTLAGGGLPQNPLRLAQVNVDGDTIQGNGSTPNPGDRLRLGRVYTDKSLLGSGAPGDALRVVPQNATLVSHDSTLQGQGTQADPLGFLGTDTYLDGNILNRKPILQRGTMASRRAVIVGNPSRTTFLDSRFRPHVWDTSIPETKNRNKRIAYTSDIVRKLSWKGRVTVTFKNLSDVQTSVTPGQQLFINTVQGGIVVPYYFVNGDTALVQENARLYTFTDGVWMDQGLQLAPTPGQAAFIWFGFTQLSASLLFTLNFILWTPRDQVQWHIISGGTFGPQGPAGVQGPAGTGFDINYTADDVSELPIGQPGQAAVVGGHLYVWITTTNEWQDVGPWQGPQGDKGDIGDTGPGLTIQGRVETYSQLVAEHPTADPGDAYIVDDGGLLYIWNEFNSSWDNRGRIVGDAGAQGIQGVPGPNGSSPYIGISGNWYLAGTDLGVPATGPKGNPPSILGTYPTETDLREAHPIGNLGDLYIVGTDLYAWWSSDNDWHNVGRFVGLQGPQGNPGTSVQILGSYQTIDDLREAQPIGNIGDGYIIRDDGNLYVWMNTSSDWEDVGSLAPHIGANGNWFIGDVDTSIQAQGPQGEQGIQGEMPVLTIDYGDPDSSTFLNWFINGVDTGVSSRGAQGDPGPAGAEGPQGIQGPPGPPGVGMTQGSVTYSYAANGSSVTYSVPSNAAKGVVITLSAVSGGGGGGGGGWYGSNLSSYGFGGSGGGGGGGGGGATSAFTTTFALGDYISITLGAGGAGGTAGNASPQPGAAGGLLSVVSVKGGVQQPAFSFTLNGGARGLNGGNGGNAPGTSPYNGQYGATGAGGVGGTVASGTGTVGSGGITGGPGITGGNRTGQVGGGGSGGTGAIGYGAGGRGGDGYASGVTGSAGSGGQGSAVTISYTVVT